MVEIENSFERGDRVRVEYEAVEHKPNGEREVNRRVDEGEVVASPSRKFDWEGDEFDFDYELDAGAVRSVNIDDEVIAQLFYEAGGDRDWDQWDLLKIERVN